MLRKSLEAKIRWNCRRGMLELDLILQRFIENRLANLSDAELSTFSCLLEYSDPQLLSFLMEESTPDSQELIHCVANIQRYSHAP